MNKNVAILMMLLMLIAPIAGCMSNDDGSSEETSKIIDSDGDGVLDSVDNCPDLFNPEQFTGPAGYECSEDELRSQINPPIVIPRSGGGNQVTDLQIAPSSFTYDLQDTIEASFIGTWFWWQNQNNVWRPPNVDVAIDLEDSQGNVVYQNVIAFSGMSVALDSHSPNDPTIGKRIWDETGPAHPIFGGSNGLDFSASTLGLGIFCWVGSLTAQIDVAGQYHTTGSHYTHYEDASATECFEIVQNLSNNPPVSIPNDDVTLCDSNSTMYTDVYSTNLSNMAAVGRLQSTYSTNDFHTAPWFTVEAPVVYEAAWGSPPVPSDWAWLDVQEAGSTVDPIDFVGNIDLKMQFDVPQNAFDVTAAFYGKVDNTFTSLQHPDLSSHSQLYSAAIQHSNSQTITNWMMPLANMPAFDWFQVGQSHTGWLPDSGTNSAESYDFLISARNHQHWNGFQYVGSPMGVAMVLEVRYCLSDVVIDDDQGDDSNNDNNNTSSHDNHPPHIDAEVYFTDPAMLNYVYSDGDTADQYDYSAFISWDTWDIDGVVETVEVDYDRDGVADVMLPENESPYYHLIYPYHHGVEFERAIMDGVCYILSFRMIDLIATDDDGDSVTYTIRTGTDEVNDWDYPENGVPATSRRDAQWLMDIYLVQDTEYLDWIYGVGTNECPSPIEYEFEESPDPLSDGGLIGTLNIISMGDESYPSNHMIGATITATDPATGNPVTGSCGVSFVYNGPGPNLAAGEYWEIYEIDSGDGLVCGIDPADVGSYTWELNLYGSQFNLPNSYITIT